MEMNYFQTCHKCTQMADMLDRHSEHPRLKCLQHHNLGQRRIPNFLEYIYRFSTKIKRYNICTYHNVVEFHGVLGEIQYRIRFNTTPGFYFSKLIFDPILPHKNA